MFAFAAAEMGSDATGATPVGAMAGVRTPPGGVTPGFEAGEGEGRAGWAVAIVAHKDIVIRSAVNVALACEVGRRSYRELGDAVQLSANAAADRVRRMTDEGIIINIRANVSAAKLGRLLVAQMDVKLRQGVSAATFERALVGVAQIQSASVMTGSFDYAVRVACRDQDDLLNVTEYLPDKGGAQETYSRLILKEVNTSGALRRP
jgi:Lrp/AsnC family transcriptional regulator, leucine-responsive regulatory protein